MKASNQKWLELSKTQRLLLFLILLGSYSGLTAQSVIHPWHVVDNGGGHSTAGGILLQASIGQPAVAIMTSVGTNLESGYIPGLRFLSGTTSILDVAFEAGWNMISVPMAVPDFRKTVLYPSGTSSAFYYKGSYAIRETLTSATGYWIKFSAPGSSHFTGTSLLRDTIPVSDKWNMIGCLSYPMLTSDILPLDSTSTVSFYWSYTNGSGYLRADTLQPGKSYWIKVHNSGRLLLKTGSMLMQPSAASIRKKWQPLADAQEEMNSLRITDATGNERMLYFAAQPVGADVAKWEMPPVPFEGTMDARFATNRMAEAADPHQKKSVSINIASATYPLTISWRVDDNASGTILMVGNKTVQLTTAGEAHIPDAATRLSLSFAPSSAIELPKEYALHQNFPNPFNPATTIRYDLPEASHVRIVIYDALGRQVAILGDEVQEAGFKSMEWNATNNQGHPAASGMYFYRIEAWSVAQPSNNFVDVRKMIILK
jgi:hypothetical protein